VRVLIPRRKLPHVSQNPANVGHPADMWTSTTLNDSRQETRRLLSGKESAAAVVSIFGIAGGVPVLNRYVSAMIARPERWARMGANKCGRYACAIIIAALICTSIGICQTARNKQLPRTPPSGYVPDSTTAVKIAEAVLIPVYGEEKVLSERPFKAEFSGDTWTVSGTLRCPDGKGGTTTHCVGGTAEVKLSKTDGRILSVMHYK
jgi:hypothetical protein